MQSSTASKRTVESPVRRYKSLLVGLGFVSLVLSLDPRRGSGRAPYLCGEKYSKSVVEHSNRNW